MTIAKLEQAARAAMRHRDIAFIFEGLPRGYHGNPALLRQLLMRVVEGHPLANSEAYRRAHAALSEVQGARDLQSRIAALYHSPALRAEFGAERIEAAFKTPAVAREELRALSVSGKLSKEADQALNLIYETQEYSRQYGIPEAAPAVVPIPSDSTKRETEIAELRTKSVTGTLSKAEDARLNQLYEARIGRDVAEENSTTSVATKPDEYRALISKSVAGKLSPAEDSRLNELSQARAVEQGLVDMDDLSDHGDVSEEETGT